jgi:hypothetical protein
MAVMVSESEKDLTVTWLSEKEALLVEEEDVFGPSPSSPSQEQHCQVENQKLLQIEQ